MQQEKISRQENEQYSPVSYTHLDVYKRQVHMQTLRRSTYTSSPTLYGLTFTNVSRESSVPERGKIKFICKETF